MEHNASACARALGRSPTSRAPRLAPPAAAARVPAVRALARRSRAAAVAIAGGGGDRVRRATSAPAGPARRLTLVGRLLEATCAVVPRARLPRRAQCPRARARAVATPRRSGAFFRPRRVGRPCAADLPAIGRASATARSPRGRHVAPTRGLRRQRVGDARARRACSSRRSRSQSIRRTHTAIFLATCTAWCSTTRSACTRCSYSAQRRAAQGRAASPAEAARHRDSYSACEDVAEVRRLEGSAPRAT